MYERQLYLLILEFTLQFNSQPLCAMEYRLSLPLQ